MDRVSRWRHCEEGSCPRRGPNRSRCGGPWRQRCEVGSDGVIVVGSRAGVPALPLCGPRRRVRVHAGRRCPLPPRHRDRWVGHGYGASRSASITAWELRAPGSARGWRRARDASLGPRRQLFRGRCGTHRGHGLANPAAHSDQPAHCRAARYAWALLLARIDEVFPLRCPLCGADMRIIARDRSAGSAGTRLRVRSAHGLW